MKNYRLTMMVNGQPQTVKKFKTREAAMRYMDSVLFNFNLQVTDFISKVRGHSQEFYCDDHSRFFIDDVTKL